MNDEQIIHLIKAITQQGTKLDIVIESNQKLEERLTKLESLREQDIKQNEKIEQILARLGQGNDHFEKIERRLCALENAESKKAKELIKQISGVFVSVLVGAVISNLGAILHSL